MSKNKIKDITDMEVSKPFIGTKYSEAFFKNTTHIMGFCFDGTTSFRPGARFGPDALRDASFGMETYSPYQDRELEDYNVVDCGNLPIYPSKWKVTNDYFHGITKDLNIRDNKIKILTLGGEHSVSYGPIRLCLDQYEDLVIIHLDAHTDLRDGYLEEKFSHASIIRRVWDHMTPKNKLIQYGIRSGLKEESLTQLLETVKAIEATRPIYLTLDLDYFDPSFMPGTGTPEAGGEDFHSFISLIKILKNKNLIGADIVELAPNIDPTGNSSAFAAKVTREVLLALQK
jgi:agmatinase